MQSSMKNVDWDDVCRKICCYVKTCGIRYIGVIGKISNRERRLNS